MDKFLSKKSKTQKNSPSDQIYEELKKTGAIIFEGWVWKEGFKLKNWKKRYLVLATESLNVHKCYYFSLEKAPKSFVLKGSFQVSSSFIKPASAIKKGFPLHQTFNAPAKDRIYHICTEATDEWIQKTARLSFNPLSPHGSTLEFRVTEASSLYSEIKSKNKIFEVKVMALFPSSLHSISPYFQQQWPECILIFTSNAFIHCFESGSGSELEKSWGIMSKIKQKPISPCSILTLKSPDSENSFTLSTASGLFHFISKDKTRLLQDFNQNLDLQDDENMNQNKSENMNENQNQKNENIKILGHFGNITREQSESKVKQTYEETNQNSFLTRNSSRDDNGQTITFIIDGNIWHTPAIWKNNEWHILEDSGSENWVVCNSIQEFFRGAYSMNLFHIKNPEEE